MILCKENCRWNCSSKISVEDRASLLEAFHKLDVNAKNVLLFKCITKTAIKRMRQFAKSHKSASYFYKISKSGVEIQICKKALCSLYQIEMKKVDIIKSRIDDGVSAPPKDLRGRHSNRPHKMQDKVLQRINAHIKKLLVEESHYSRNKNFHKKYISPVLNITLLYQSFIEECEKEKLSEMYKIKKCTFTNVFVTQFNYSFGYPKSDTCSTCDKNGDNVPHKDNVSAAIAAMKADRERAKISTSTAFATIDLQQTMPLPKITTNKVFYLRQMWFYNFEIHLVSMKGERAVFCNWTEDMANRGSSEIASCVLRFAETCEEKYDHLVILSDSCAGQNKNFNIITLYQYLILNKYLK